MYPVIFGLEGTKLTKAEKSFLTEAQPAGIILFARNVNDPDQLKALVSDVKSVLARDHLAVFIDQEGGRIQRLKPPHWREAPPMGYFGQADRKDPELAEQALCTNMKLIGIELRELGITVDCLPVLDVPMPGSDNIIGDRAFSSDPDVVSRLGAVASNALLSEGIVPVIKHIPGHGRATVDSHKVLPLVDMPLPTLKETDFLPFIHNKNLPMAMTAHVTYKAIDAENCATLSKKVVSEVIRGLIGFKGLLISDDINMKALQGRYEERAAGCLEAGIDLVLHCNGNMGEMEQVMRALSTWDREQELFDILHQASLNEMGDRNELLWHYEELEHKIRSL